MNLEKLNESLIENSKFIDTETVSIKIDKLTLEEQKSAIGYFAGGMVKLNFYPAEKTTEQSFVHVCLVKGKLELNVGMVHVASLRKPSSRRKDSGFAHLFSLLVEDAMKPRASQTLSRDNKSMLLYALTLFPCLDSYQLINGRSYNKNYIIPPVYDTVEKVLEAFELEKFTPFKVA